MATTALVSVGEYLATSYRPDQEYIDGRLFERNVGEWNHSLLQKWILAHCILHWEPLGFVAMPELRVQVKPTRFRVPDITVVRSDPGQQILTSPPFLCVEVLSPADSMTAMQEKIEDYLTFGVENLWIVDPRSKKTFWVDAMGTHEAEDAILRAEPFEMNISMMWPKAH